MGATEALKILQNCKISAKYVIFEDVKWAEKNIQYVKVLLNCSKFSCVETLF